MLDFLLFSDSRVSSGNYFIYLQTYLEKEKIPFRNYLQVRQENGPPYN